MYFLAIACCSDASCPLRVPPKAFPRVSSLPLKNRGANNKNSPKFPPYPRLPTPVILLTIFDICAASPLSISCLTVIPFSNALICISRFHT